MRNIKMIIQYDGTRYKGWQKQTEDINTVQGKLESILGNMTGEEIQLVGCGRTDTGVHAINYTANFHTNSTMNTDDMHKYLNDKLPDDIAVKSIKNASERFHARYNILSKTYMYRINNSGIKNVFDRKYIHSIDEKLNIEKMRECAAVLVGTHDFQSFTTLKSKTKSTVRTINFINIEDNDGIIEIDVNGNGFLWNMVRIILGTLIEAGKEKLSPEDVKNILEAKKRAEAGPMVPAKALFLKDVEY
ncbi:MAG: tRNA pseudouridine(38-40) synthase TruA [Sedimentibacter saalensis]|jgi:tRNA pseudouridine38-40 synthase|uniref:tRNA pseudouridine(38-40) synthase TruA n=1 Tax=Sedimentibacter saalensis TaxID=130788 RepID=UPI002B213873|nr:tRNA pseudouridine(38-40) synthase TruA [Sedimentibacter saalensis]MEA5093739.1 tRNA pseudouridine(38-40) synthase TruA [Sedimentibacter saalensis]